MIKLKNKLENEFSKRYKETNFNNNIDSNIVLSLKKRYNDINEEVPDNLIPYVSVDERKIKFIPYSKSESFFDLDYDIMDKAISIGSKYALDVQRLGLEQFCFNDDNNIYYLDILNNKNNFFGITDVKKINGFGEEIINARNIGRSSRDTLGSSEYDKRFSTGDNKSVGYRIESEGNVEILKNKQEQRKVDESRQLDKNDIKDLKGDVENSNDINYSLLSNKELENSSFSLEQRVSAQFLRDKGYKQDAVDKMVRDRN